MSVTIRLSRTGSKNHPFYRIVVSTTRSKRDGKNHGVIGSYNPKTKSVEFDQKLYHQWLEKGAIVSTTVKKLINTAKL